MEREQIKTKLTIWYFIFWILLLIALYLAYAVYFPNTTSTKSKWVILFASSVSLLFAGCKFLEISYYKHDDENIKNETKKQNKLFAILYNCQSIILIISLGFVLYLLKAYVAAYFTFCTVLGYLIYVISSKTSSKILIGAKVKAQDANDYSITTSLKLNNNAYIASSFVYWALLCTGVVVLYHIFKDYEIIIGYITGFCSGAFFENTINAIFKNIFERIYKTIKNASSLEAYKETTEIFQNNILNCNSSKYFEVYGIILICAIIIGANSVGLMGAFLPLIMSGNAIFLSTFILLFSKVNKLNNPLKTNLKNILFISFFAGLAVILEIHYWLGHDFLSIGYNALLGALCGAAVLYFNKNNAKINLIAEEENRFSKAFMGLFVSIFLFVSSFLIAQGIDYVLFGFYNTIIAFMGFQSVVLIASIFEKNEKLNICAKTYIKISNILVFISSMLAFSMLFSPEETDIFNPLALCLVLAGFSIPFIIIKLIFNISLKQAGAIIKNFKKEKKFSVEMVKTVSFDTVVTGIIFVVLALCIYFTKRYFDFEMLVALIFGICLSCCSLIYGKNETISSISGAILRISSIFLLSIAFLFI